MIPLVDLHCHLLAGLDDGPRTLDEAVAMCRTAYADGVRWIAATAHQDERWAAVQPDRIRTATRQLCEALAATGLGLSVLPSAEIMVRPELETLWQAGELMSVADHRHFLLVEMPRGAFVNLLELAVQLVHKGVRLILAHVERYPELLHGGSRVEELIRAGCLVQVSSGSITRPRSRRDERVLREWFRRGVVHLVGSDGHSPTRRPPLLAEAYRQVYHWAGAMVADRAFSTNGLAVLQGFSPRVYLPMPVPAGWASRLWASFYS